MKIKITCRPRYNPWLKKYLNTKTFSKILALGILINSIPISSFAGILSEDGRYETFEGDNITIDNILEEDKVDVEIEGNTLVNLVDIDTSEYKEIVYSRNNVLYLGNANLFQNGKQYTIICEFSDIVGTSKVCFNFNSAGSAPDIFVRPTEGLVKHTFVMPEEPLIKDNSKVGAYYFDEYSSCKIKNLRILEGDYSNVDIEYFEGLQSSFENQIVTQEMVNSGEEKQENLGKYKVEYKATGKNKFDGELENGFIAGDTGIDTDDTQWIRSTNYISVKPNTTYTLSKSKKEGALGLRLYDNKLNYLGMFHGITDGMYSSSIVVPSNCHYLRFNIVTELSTQFQIEEGSVATSYEPYKESINIFYLNSPLLEGDTIEYIDGKTTHIKRSSQLFFDGSEDWYKESSFTTDNYTCFTRSVSDLIKRGDNVIVSDKFVYKVATNTEEVGIWESYSGDAIRIKVQNSIARTVSEFRQWLSENPVTVAYELANPIYESIKADLSVNLFEGTTHISTNSTIPANLKVTVDRVANRAKEYSELAKENPTIENISLARMWTNKMRESILKDEFQDSVDSITEITDMTLERKTASANLDVYIKSENILMMNLSTNSITFDDFSGVEDMTKENAVNININSSLPYNLNAYLSTEIQNSDKSNTMNKDILSIKDNSEADYQTFTNTVDKITLKSNCNSGNDKQHDINLKLNGGIAHEKDVYKTTIKFEAEQQ